MKNNDISAKDYLKLVEWIDEDGCFVGSAPPLIGPSCHGDDETEVYRELCQIVEEWIAIHKEDGRSLPEPTVGKEYSGRFVLRVGEEMHRLLAIRALQDGDSLNSYCLKILSRKL